MRTMTSIVKYMGFLSLVCIGIFGNKSWVWAQQGQLFYYNFQDRDSALIKDESGMGNDAVVRNYKESPFRIEEEKIRNKKVNTLYLSGGKNGSYVQLPKNILAGCSEITISMWVKMEQEGSYQRIWDFGNDTGSYLYLQSGGGNENAKGYSAAMTKEGWTAEKTIFTGWNLPKNQWVFTTVTIQEDEMALYLDGELLGRNKTGIPLSQFQNTARNYLGFGQFEDDPPQAAFAECALFNYAMNQEDIEQLYERVCLEPSMETLELSQVLSNYYVNFGESVGMPSLMGRENPRGKKRGELLGEYISFLAHMAKKEPEGIWDDKGMEILSEIRRLQAQSEARQWGKGYFSSYSIEEWAALERGADYPDTGMLWMEQGKLLTGLLDFYEAVGRVESLQIAGELADWMIDYVGGWSRERREEVLSLPTVGKTGNMGNQMIRLYEHTGADAYLDGAELFVERTLLRELGQGKFSLDNQNVTKVLEEAMTIYHLARLGKADYLKGAKHLEELWEYLVSDYTYASGALGIRGIFPDERRRQAECNSGREPHWESLDRMLEFTMLLSAKKTEDPRYLNYYEKTLMNLYYGQWEKGKEYAFVQGAKGGFLQLYFPGTYQWEAAGLVLRVEMNLVGGTGKIYVEKGKTSEGKPSQLHLRIPEYTGSKMNVQKNGKEIKKIRKGYFVMSNVQEGDVLEVDFAYALHTSESLTGEREYTVRSFLYGPFLLGSRDVESKAIHILWEDLRELEMTVKKDSFYLAWEGKILVPYYQHRREIETTYYKMFLAEEKEQWHSVQILPFDEKRGRVEIDHEILKKGDRASVSVYPEEGYRIDLVKANEQIIKPKEENKITLENVERDIYLEVRFSVKNPQKPDPEKLEQTAQTTAHYTAAWERLEGIKDENFQPKSSDEGLGKGWGDWQQEPGSQVWVEYSWETFVTADTCEIYWYDDKKDTGAPKSLEILYLDEKDRWQKAERKEKRSCFVLDQFNKITFEEVRTKKIRLQMRVAENKQAVGIYRWKVSGTEDE